MTRTPSMRFAPLPAALLAPLFALALTACGGAPVQPPPPAPLTFEGLPIAGSLASANTQGFLGCLGISNHKLRCRKSGVMLFGAGPYDAAVDLAGDDGSGGFDRLTLWHESDQGAILDLGEALKKADWHSCLLGEQEDYTRPGSPIRIAIDASYWGKRRAVISSEGREARPRC